MPTFVCPSDPQVSPVNNYFGDVPAEADPLMVRLMSHYRSGPRGRNVFLMQDGSITEVQPPNWDPSNPTDPYAYSYTYAGGSQPATGVVSFSQPAAQQVKRIYWGGGCVNQITAAEATVLQAAGYTTGP